MKTQGSIFGFAYNQPKKLLAKLYQSRHPGATVREIQNFVAAAMDHSLPPGNFNAIGPVSFFVSDGEHDLDLPK